jgi:hypothetical protein
MEVADEVEDKASEHIGVETIEDIEVDTAADIVVDIVEGNNNNDSNRRSATSVINQDAGLLSTLLKSDRVRTIGSVTRPRT